jgi:hypothetical protein
VINTEEGLLDKAIAPKIAAGIAKVIEGDFGKLLNSVK